jgi:hypothetical protein
MRNFDEETDGFCPKCDNQFFIEAKTPQGGFVVQFQGDSNMVRDDREKQRNAVSKQTEEMNRE